MSEEFEHIKVEMPIEKDKDGNVVSGTIDGNYAVISINRPNKLNALTEQTVEEIAKAFRALEPDQKVRAVVLRGTKEVTKKPAFSAGADLSAVLPKELNPKVPWHMALAMRRRHKFYDEIEAFSKPIIAAVDGFALGGGCELTLVCDIVIATTRSNFGLPEINRAILPANGGVTRMASRIGLNRAIRMGFFGEHFDAETMKDWGYVSWVAEPGEEFENLVHEKASWLGSAPTTALYVIKKCIKFGTKMEELGKIMEQMGFQLNSHAKDVSVGIKAFLRKKEPKYKGM
ncbi:MAG: enoyl-CoA hydratase/isomerase family protein [Promethearchaeota archaeon]|nr:MAG: enoyl-CoA hydratase/isomerase family protein [Candidatus Lokiarchaeota archaeon]